MKTTSSLTADHHPQRQAFTGVSLHHLPLPKVSPTLGNLFRHRDRGLRAGRTAGK